LKPNEPVGIIATRHHSSLLRFTIKLGTR
jgi:hypothetical protein